VATLDLIENQPVLETIEKRGKILMAGIGDILTEASIPHVVTGVPSMFGIFLGSDEEPRDFREYLAGDGELYEAIGMGLSQRGIQPDADGREPWFLCYALSEEDVAETLNVFNDAVKEATRIDHPHSADDTLRASP
jgi:glutamate-1-semialdehyde 2,1-aminomutase